MATYVVFDKSTGQPLHTHIESEASRISLNEVVTRVNPSLDAKKVEMVLVDEQEMARVTPGKIDPKTRRLVDSGKSKVTGFGGGGVASSEELLTPPNVRLVFDTKSLRTAGEGSGVGNG